MRVSGTSSVRVLAPLQWDLQETSLGGVTHTVKSAAGVSEYTSSATKEWFPNVDAARAKYPHSPAIQGSDGRFYVVILNSENVTSTKTTVGYLPGGTPPPGK